MIRDLPASSQTVNLRGSCRAGFPEDSLRITHRLDVATEGVLVLGKTAEFVSQFNKLLGQGEQAAVRKLYRTLR